MVIAVLTNDTLPYSITGSPNTTSYTVGIAVIHDDSSEIRRNLMVGKIILAIVSFVVFPVGWIIGGWYFFRKKEKAPGGLFAGLGLLALILIIVVSPGDSTQPVTTQQGVTKAASTPEPVPIGVSLREILDLRDANEVAADTKYIGMYVSMEGEITQIHEDDFYIVPLGSDAFQLSGAKCKFDKSQSADLIQLRKGQSITIVGIIKDIDDFVFNELEIKPCRFSP